MIGSVGQRNRSAGSHTGLPSHILPNGDAAPAQLRFSSRHVRQLFNAVREATVLASLVAATARKLMPPSFSYSICDGEHGSSFISINAGVPPAIFLLPGRDLRSFYLQEPRQTKKINIRSREKPPSPKPQSLKNRQTPLSLSILTIELFAQ